MTGPFLVPPLPPEERLRPPQGAHQGPRVRHPLTPPTAFALSVGQHGFLLSNDREVRLVGPPRSGLSTCGALKCMLFMLADPTASIIALSPTYAAQMENVRLLIRLLHDGGHAFVASTMAQRVSVQNSSVFFHTADRLDKWRGGSYTAAWIDDREQMLPEVTIHTLCRLRQVSTRFLWPACFWVTEHAHPREHEPSYTREGVALRPYHTYYC